MGVAQKIVGFLGVLPRTAERLLPEMGAQAAENVNLTSGEIRPVRPPLIAYTPTPQAQQLSAYRAEQGGVEKWRAWTVDVDVAKAPLSPDVEQRYYWTGDGCPRYATFTNFGATDWALGIPNPTTKSTVTVTGGSSTTTVTRSYCYTFYQPSTGEETGASPVADPVSGKIDGTWTISGFSGTPANDRTVAYNTSGLYQRLYRTAGTSADWQLVAERAVSTGNWTDTLSDADILGDSLITSGWQPPPVGMKGIITLPNGSVCGFYGNELIFSEPYQPHAYPDIYRYQTESEIVGIAAYGTTVVVCTKTRPYVADGVTPDVVTMQSIGNVWPCMSKRSVCSVGDGVVFATKHGLAYVGSAGAQIFTRALYTVEEWTPLNPASMQCVQADSRVYIRYKPSDGQVQLLKLDMQEAAILSSYSTDGNALYTDTLNGKLYVIGTDVALFDGYYGQRMTYNWKSKAYEFPERINLGAGLIEYEATMSATEIQAAYSVQQSDLAANQAIINAGLAVGAFGQNTINGDPIDGAFGITTPRSPAEFLTYTLYDHEQAVATIPVISGKAFRLPSGYKTDVIAHQLTGNVRVRYVKVAQTMTDLKQV